MASEPRLQIVYCNIKLLFHLRKDEMAMQHFLTRPHGSKVLDHWMPPFLATNQVCFHIIDSTLNNSTDCIKKVVRTSAVYQTLPSMTFVNWLCSCELNQMNLMPEPSSIRQFYKALLPSSIQHCTMLRSITVGVIESQIQQIPRFRSFFIQMKKYSFDWFSIVKKSG